MIKRTIQLGFTLIELLLVIAVIAVMAAIGIMSYRHYFETNRLDKAAIGTQHVLEAAMAYYVDHSNQWPDAHGCSAMGNNDNFITGYLPNADDKSAYGTPYCWQSAGDNHHLFWVALVVPGSDELTASNLAKRLAGRLPNAIATTDPSSSDAKDQPCGSGSCYVRAEVTAPGSSNHPKDSFTLAAAGNCQTGQEIHSPTGSCKDISGSDNQAYRIFFKACPSGMAPNLVVSPNDIHLPEVSAGWAIVRMNAQQYGGCSSSASNGQQSCDAVVSVMVCTSARHCDARDIKTMMKKYPDITVGASYIVSCHGNSGVMQ